MRLTLLPDATVAVQVDHVDIVVPDTVHTTSVAVIVTTPIAMNLVVERAHELVLMLVAPTEFILAASVHSVSAFAAIVPTRALRLPKDAHEE